MWWRGEMLFREEEVGRPGVEEGEELHLLPRDPHGEVVRHPPVPLHPPQQLHHLLLRHEQPGHPVGLAVQEAGGREEQGEGAGQGREGLHSERG